MLTASRRWKRREGEPQAGAPGLAVWLDQARARWQGVLRSGAILQRTCHHKLDLALDGVRDALASPPSRRRPGRLAFASASKSAVGAPPGEPLSSDPILISEVRETKLNRAAPQRAWQTLLHELGRRHHAWQSPASSSHRPIRPDPGPPPPTNPSWR